MIALLLLGLVQSTGEVVTIRQGESLELPGEIATSVAPYLMCMVEDRNGRIVGLSSGDAVRAGIEQLKADCRSARDEAEASARERLHSSSVPTANREPMIANALTSIDHSRDRVAEHLDQANHRSE